jgi:hypothetical protein
MREGLELIGHCSGVYFIEFQRGVWTASRVYLRFGLATRAGLTTRDTPTETLGHLVKGLRKM